MANYSYIPREYLPNLKTYKYNAVDKSLISKYVLKEYWNQLVKIFPLTMAANMVTLLGFLHVVFAFLVNLWYAPELNEALPSWVYYLYAACIWIYGSFDAVDGKQARRTGTSGPLGEMFDHGCDSLSVTASSLLMLLQATSMRLGQTWWTVAFVASGLANFYMSTMEEYHTHVLYLGYFSGPVEGIILATVGFIMTGALGSGIWLSLVRDHIPLVPASLAQLLPAINFGQLIVVLIVCGLVPTVLASLHNIMLACCAERKSVFAAYADSIPFISVLTSMYIWLYNSPLLRTQHLVLFMTFVALAFSYIVGRVIIAHVTKAPFPKLNRMHVPLFIGTANALFPALFGADKPFDGAKELGLVYACLIYAAIQYGHFVLSVIDEICSYMDINCLTIKHPKKAQ
ncbi:hypothetical protein EV182_001020 [Spiromyces aspiralis]|uniref:Uncharacterized protein n=1 Tax=Spiromyces aspiralis TaxID=68401 RepID=A0ACC1HJR1_9FUNG|nr:hypothetical protein EV182_001020 [Spiromyces aspiralis]